MGSVPLEILREIFTFLKPDDLGRVSRVCKFWKLISEQGLLWKKYCDSETQIFLGKDPNVNWKQEFIKSEYTAVLEIKEKEGKGWRQPIHSDKSIGASFDFQLKILLVGASGVGKSSFLEYFQGKPWTDNPRFTIGMELVHVQMVEEGITFKLQIWDRERSDQRMTSNYFRNNFATLIIYDMTRRETFEELKYLYEDVEVDSDPKSKIVICANKSDLRNEEKIQYLEREIKREEFVPDEEGLKWAQKHNCKFISMSTKQKFNLCEALQTVIGNVKTWRKIKESQPEEKEQNQEAPLAPSRLQYAKNLLWDYFKKT